MKIGIPPRGINNRKGVAYVDTIFKEAQPTSRPNYKDWIAQPQTYPQVFASFESIQGVHFQGQKTKVLMNKDACPIY